MKEEIIKLRKEGLSYNEISKRLNCAKSTVSYHCSKLEENNEIEKRNNLAKNTFLQLSKKDIKAIVDLRNEKTSYDDIKKKLNIPLYKIKIICNRYNITRVDRLTEEIIEEIIALYSVVKNMRKVANKLNVSLQSVMKYTEKEELTDEEKKKRKSINVINWRKRKKIELVEYMGGCCVICGYKKSFRALQFHHKDPKEKDFTISGKSWSFERLKKEVDKCILVCSNCHTEIHDEIDKTNNNAR